MGNNSEYYNIDSVVYVFLMPCRPASVEQRGRKGGAKDLLHDGLKWRYECASLKSTTNASLHAQSPPNLFFDGSQNAPGSLHIFVLYIFFFFFFLFRGHLSARIV